MRIKQIALKAVLGLAAVVTSLSFSDKSIVSNAAKPENNESIRVVSYDEDSQISGDFFSLVNYATSSKGCSITLSTVNYTYTGSAIKPSVTVKDSNGKTISADNYTVSYSNNVAVGKAVITVKFKGKYTGTLTKKFNIIPKTTTLKSATVVADGINIKWSKNTSAGGYYIYKSVNGGDYKLIKTISGNSTVEYKDTLSKSNGAKYQYKIIAYKKVNGTNFNSKGSKVKTAYYLARPTVSAKNLATGVQLSWKSNTSATGYCIYRSEDGTNYTKIKTLIGSNQNSYVDTSAKKKQTKYYYRVSPIKVVGSTTYYGAISITKADFFVSRPGLGLSDSTKGVKVSWGKNTKATGYYIYRSTDGKNYKKIKTITDNTTTSYVDTAASSSGTKYYYKVITYKVKDKNTYVSAASEAKSIIYFKKPTISRCTNVPDNKVVVRWDENKDATGYQLQYSTDKNFTNATFVNIDDSSRYTKLIQNLPEGKTYYIRVRSYKTSGSTTSCSEWSKVRKITTRTVGTGSSSSSFTVGDSYVDLDLGKQHLYVYVKGKLIFEADCVSGCTGLGYGTPAGLYRIGTLERNATLVGTDYQTVVSYWIPFIGNGIGFHDASWKSEFGGEIYKTDGSHGCINLSTSDAKKMYGLVYKGLPVVVYY